MRKAMEFTPGLPDSSAGDHSPARKTHPLGWFAISHRERQWFLHSSISIPDSNPSCVPEPLLFSTARYPGLKSPETRIVPQETLRVERLRRTIRPCVKLLANAVALSAPQISAAVLFATPPPPVNSDLCACTCFELTRAWQTRTNIETGVATITSSWAPPPGRGCGDGPGQKRRLPSDAVERGCMVITTRAAG